MAQTYEPIATTTIASATSSYTFSAIPSTYDDLILVYYGKTTTGGGTVNFTLRFNGDTGSNYSLQRIYGEGSTTGASVFDNYATILTDYGMADSQFMLVVADIIGYKNGLYKTVLTRPSEAYGSGVGSTNRTVATWRNTAAITSITAGTNGSTMAVGSVITLFGITAA